MVFLATIWVMSACNRDLSSNEGPQAPPITSNAQLGALNLPYRKAALILTGTTFPVALSRKLEANSVTFSLSAHDEVIEEEQFEYSEAGFRLAGASGESYHPPIPLLQFPMKVGDSWNWKGIINVGTIQRTATANIACSSDVLNTAGGPFDAVLVSVELIMPSGAVEPAKRRLRFWFVRGKGILKREFGAASTREPLTDQR